MMVGKVRIAGRGGTPGIRAMTGGPSVAVEIPGTPVRTAPARTGIAGVDSPLSQGASTVNMVCSAVPSVRDDADGMRTAPAGVGFGPRGALAAAGGSGHERARLATGCVRAHGIGATVRAGGIGFGAVSLAAAGPLR
jgi:hypothetical protein